MTTTKRTYRQKEERRNKQFMMRCSAAELQFIHDIVNLMRQSEPTLSTIDAILRCVRLMQAALQPK